MLVRPMIGSWEVRGIESIGTRESRRLAVLPVPGLSGDLHQDLGRDALSIEISGSLHGDEARDAFLKQLRAQFLAGEPVDFVADIAGESELEQVLIESFELEESAAPPDTFRYRIILREHTEAPSAGFGAGGAFDASAFGAGGALDLDTALDLDAAIALDAKLGLDLLDLPGLLFDVPKLGDLLSPLDPAAQKLRKTIAEGTTLLEPLKAKL